MINLTMIQIENTPNPNALKFLSKNIISEIGSVEFQKKDLEKAKNSIVKNILKIDGVELILLSENFLSVKKNDKVNWDNIKPVVISYLNDYFEKSKKPILTKEEKSKNEVSHKKDKNDTIDKINDVLETKIKPAVARDGGDIKFVSFEKGVVTVELRGSCSGCPSSALTLKRGVQNLLKHYVEGVESVEAI
tara:strand:+ start:2601 stop:3173 length:573 start_codon:yes stop_codon:yes gene_type:complete